MAHSRHQPTTNGVPVRNPTLKKDKWIDLQYANLDCKCHRIYNGDLQPCPCEEKFISEPWNHCDDHTSTFLGLRFKERAKFKDNLGEAKLKRVEHEEKRIADTRAHFSSYENKKHLMRDLNQARHNWQTEASSRSGSHVKPPQTPQNAPETFITTNPEQLPLYGFKACAMYFQKSDGKGYEGHNSDHPRLKSMKFPNQKLLVHDLLNDKTSNLLSEECSSNQLRYFHLPTNNMDWIEKAMARYYDEDDGDHSNHKGSKETTKAERLLCREFWRGQLHGGGRGGGPIHARHMRSRCSIVPLDLESGSLVQRMSSSSSIDVLSDPDSPTSRVPKAKGKNFAIFLPYLHWETDGRRAKMAEVIKEVTTKHEEQENQRIIRARRVPQKEKTKLWPINKNTGWKKRRDNEVEEMDETIPGQRGIWDVLSAWNKGAKRPKLKGIFTEKKRSKLGTYLLLLAQVADELDYEADERLLRDNLHHDPPLHTRRTLDQSYFLALDDTANRDKDQVVYRETKECHTRSHQKMNARVVMVDQLWLWILDDNTIITSFPRRWGRNKPDPSGVHKSLRDRLEHMPKGQIHSIYDLALIIIDQCSRVFFDRTKPLDHRPEVMDLFASAIGRVSERTTMAHQSFWDNMQIRALHPAPYGSAEKSSHKYLDINPEGTLLKEAHDISEELRIMLQIYNQQMQVIKDFRKALRHMNGESKNETDDIRALIRFYESRKKKKNSDPSTTQTEKPQLVPESTIQEANDLLELIRTRQAEIQDLEDAAQRTSQQLQGLLSLKQQQASIIEAKAALKRADESVKQGRAIMAFTLVTILFLPLGFFAAFFGMNNQEINDAPWMSLSEQVKYMFGLSALVVIIAVSTAFSPWTRAFLTVLIKVPFTFVAEYTGIRGLWKLHSTLETKGQQKLDYIIHRQARLDAAKREEAKKQETQEMRSHRLGSINGQASGYHNGSTFETTTYLHKSEGNRISDDDIV